MKRNLKIRKNAWSIVREAQEKGNLVAITSEVEQNRTALNDKLSEHFKCQCPGYEGTFDEEDGELVLEKINDYLKKNRIEMHPLDFPAGGGVDLFLVPIGRSILLKVLVADEYYGDGEYSKYVDISYFIINEKTSMDDVLELVDFVREYLIVAS